MIYRRVLNFPSWRWKSPFEELEQMRRQMDRLFEELSGTAVPRRGAGVYPLVNLTEDRDNYYVRSELPGVQAADLDIQATTNSLSISGERKIPAEDPSAKYHRKERNAGKFSRIIDFPGVINTDGVKAKLTDGILTLVIPKAESQKPRQISVR
jgi:HSP20 family protein